MLSDKSGARDEALHILTGVTSIVVKSADGEAMLGDLARWLVPRLADACAIELVDDGVLRVVATEPSDTTRAGILRGAPCRSEPVSGVEDAQSRVARTGASERFADVGDDARAAPADDVPIHSCLDVQSMLVVPIRGAQWTLGVLTLSVSQRAFDASDQQLVEEIASRVAFSLERARLGHDVAAQRARSQLLANTSRSLATQLDFDGVARSVASAVRGGVVVGLAATNEVVMQAGACVDSRVGQNLQSLIGRSVPFDAGMLDDDAHRLRELRLIDHHELDSLPPPFAGLAHGLGVGSAIVAPLRVQERVIGVMVVFRDVHGAPLGRDDVSLVSEIADRAATAFERARLFEDQQRTTRRLRLLADAGTLLAQSLEVAPTLATLARLAVGWFAEACAVDLREEGRTTGMAVATADSALERATRHALERYAGASSPPSLGRVLDSAKPMLLREMNDEALRGFAIDDAHYAELLSLGVSSLIIVPLVARGLVLGVLSLARSRGPRYDEDDLALAAELGRRAALAIDNARLFKRATEAVAVRDEFLAIASHELNTPLTPLKMQLDSLRRGKFAPDRVMAKLDAASRQVTRLTKLVSELLDVSRISGGRLHLHCEDFDLAELIDEVVSGLAEEAERAASPIVLRGDRPCFGSWDRMRIDQVVTNLLTNAIKYGSGKPIEIELSCRREAVRLVVRDHGIGIAPEHQRRIFERFERAASVRHYGGFGLGLWIARQIVEASEGSIAVESAPGAGSTFIVDLPASHLAIVTGTGDPSD